MKLKRLRAWANTQYIKRYDLSLLKHIVDPLAAIFSNGKLLKALNKPSPMSTIFLSHGYSQ